MVKRICGDDSERVASRQNSNPPGYPLNETAFLNDEGRCFGFYRLFLAFRMESLIKMGIIELQS